MSLKNIIVKSNYHRWGGNVLKTHEYWQRGRKWSTAPRHLIIGTGNSLSTQPMAKYCSLKPHKQIAIKLESQYTNTRHWITKYRLEYVGNFNLNAFRLIRNRVIALKWVRYLVCSSSRSVNHCKISFPEITSWSHKTVTVSVRFWCSAHDKIINEI